MHINSATEEHCGTDVMYLWEGQDTTTVQKYTGRFSLKAIILFERARDYHCSDAPRKIYNNIYFIYYIIIIITLFFRSWMIL